MPALHECPSMGLTWWHGQINNNNNNHKNKNSSSNTSNDDNNNAFQLMMSQVLAAQFLSLQMAKAVTIPSFGPFVGQEQTGTAAVATINVPA